MKKLNDRDKIKSDFINNDELPKDWKFSSIENLSTSIQYGYTASALQNFEGPRLLRITDIQNDTVNWDTVPSCEITKENFLKFELKPGDIVFARTGATTGKSYLIQSCPKAVFASYLIRIRPNNSVDPHFLILFFQTMDYWRMISENVAGITQPNCNASKLKNLTVPVPPLSEQHRIIARVEALFSQINAARDRLNSVPLIMKRFRQAVLAAACRGRLTEGWRDGHEGFLQSKQEIPQWKSDVDLPISWSWVSPEKIVKQETPHSLAIGPFGSDLKVSDYTSSGVPLIFVRNIRSGSFSDISTKYISSIKAKELAAHKVQSRDVLITKMGDPPGDARIYPENVPDGIITADCIKMSLNPLIANPNYIEHAINSRLVKNQIYGITMGVAQSKISLARFKKIGIPLPPIEEQHEIIRRVDALFALADEIEKQVADATKRTEALKQAVLAKAFRGELVATNAELASSFVKLN